MKKLLIWYILLVGYINGAGPDPVFGENGMVVSTSRHASIAGIEILKRAGMLLMLLVPQVLSWQSHHLQMEILVAVGLWWHIWQMVKSLH